jgi:hypothetical protein
MARSSSKCSWIHLNQKKKKKLHSSVTKAIMVWGYIGTRFCLRLRMAILAFWFRRPRIHSRDIYHNFIHMLRVTPLVSRHHQNKVNRKYIVVPHFTVRSHPISRHSIMEFPGVPRASSCVLFELFVFASLQGHVLPACRTFR